MVLGSNTESIRRSVLEEVRQQTQGLQTAAGLVEDFAPIVEGVQADVAAAETDLEYIDTRAYDVRKHGGGNPTFSGAAVQAAATAAAADGVGAITGPKGTYTFTTAFSHPPNVTLDFPRGTVFDMTGVSSLIGSSVWYGEGALTALPALSSPVDKDGRSVVLASAPAVTSGDFVMLSSNVDYSFHAERSYYRKGEVVQVQSLSSATITTVKAIYDSYLADGTVTAHKMAKAEFGATGIHVLLPDGKYGLTFSLATRVTLDITTEGGNWGAINLRRCVNITLNQPRAFSSSITDGAGVNYGVALFNCQDIILNQPDLTAGSHGFTTGGGVYTGNIGSIPCRNITINGGTLTCSRETSVGMDTHGNTEYVWLNGVKMPKGMHLAGDHIYVDEHCEIESNGAGNGVILNRLLGWDIVIKARMRATKTIPASGFVVITPGAEVVRTEGKTLTIEGVLDLGPYRAASGSTLPISVTINTAVKGNLRLGGKVMASGTVAGTTVAAYVRKDLGGNLARVTLAGEWTEVGALVINTDEVVLDNPRSINSPAYGFNATAPRIRAHSPYVRGAGTVNLQLDGGDATKATGDIIVINPVSLDANETDVVTTTNAGLHLRNAKALVLIGPVVGDTRGTTKQRRAYVITAVGTLHRTPVAILGTMTTVTETPDATVNI